MEYVIRGLSVYIKMAESVGNEIHIICTSTVRYSRLLKRSTGKINI
jgi:hypothetical protein